MLSDLANNFEGGRHNTREFEQQVTSIWIAKCDDCKYGLNRADYRRYGDEGYKEKERVGGRERER